MVQMLVGFGDPALQDLTDPPGDLCELPAGHWPMLSLPAEPAQVLLRAAAGEGCRLVAHGSAQPPAHLRPFLPDVPEGLRERTGGWAMLLVAAAPG